MLFQAFICRSLAALVAFLASAVAITTFAHAQNASVIVRVENRTAATVEAYALAPDGGQPTFLGRVDSGFYLDLGVSAGIGMGFASGGNWIGSPYAVTDAPTQTVSPPVQAAAAAPRIGDGSVVVRIENPSGQTLGIHHILPDKSAAPFVAKVDAGFYIDIPAQAEALIGFADGSGWVGNPYSVTADPAQTIRIPILDSAPEVAETPRTIGDGSALVRVENPGATILHVHHILDDGSDAPEVAAVEAGAARDIAAQAGVLLGFSDGSDWVGGQYVVTGMAPEAIVIPLPEVSAGPAVVGDGSVAVAIANPSNQQMGVHVIPETGDSQLVAAIEPGGSIDLRAQAGFRLGFSPGSDWYGGSYLVGAAPAQQITLPVPNRFTAGRGSVSVTVTNTASEELGLFLLGGDAAVPVGTMAAGETVELFADPGMAFGVSPGGSYVGGTYTVSEAASQAVSMPLPLSAGSGSAVVRVSNASGGDLTVLRMPTDAAVHAGALAVIAAGAAGDAAAANAAAAAVPQPEALGMVAAGGSVDVATDAGVKIGFADSVGYVGGIYVVPSPGFHGVAAPQPVRVGDGTVVSTMTNTGGAAMSVNTIDGSNATTLGTIRPGETLEVRSSPCTMFGFASLTSGEWMGGMVQVTRDQQQALVVPTAQDSDPAKCMLLTNEQMDTVLARLAADQARIEQEEKQKTRVCWKDSYGRGVGTIPTTCAAGTQEQAGLCYDKCRSGFTGAVTMCAPDCPAGFTDTGLHCFKPAPVTRSAFPWKFGDKPFSLDDARARCARSADGRRYGCGTYNSNTIVYSECPSGFRTAPVVTSLCSPVCPSNTIDIGISCQKITYDRGVGRIKECAPGKQADAGLCYDQCSQGYAGVGPVCWNQCPAKLPVNCGASCAASKNDCAMAITDQVTGPIMTAASIALIAVTAGAAAGGTAALNTAKAGGQVAAKTGAQLTAKSMSRVGAQQLLRQQVISALSKAASNAVVKAVASDMIMDTAISAVISGAVYGGMSEAGKAATRKQIRDAFDQRYKTGGEIDPKVVDAAVAAAIAGAEQTNPAADFPWESLDPTGIADMVRAYNLPICSNVK